jgi:hypothetical protein
LRFFYYKKEQSVYSPQGNFFLIVAFVIIGVMKKSSLIATLSVLTNAELTQLDKFIGSAYFNTSSRAAQLYNILRAAYPAFEEKCYQKRNCLQIYFWQKAI